MDVAHGAAIRAENLGMKGPRGWVFRGITLDASPGALIAVEGASGSGRTCLLLALTGRMKPTEGWAEVAGHRVPRKMAAVRRISALGPVPDVTDLDPSLTVAEQLRERALLRRRYDGPVRALLRPRAERAARTRSAVSAALDLVGLDLDTLPKGPRTSVRMLERLEELRLSLALALLADPQLVAVDDLDLKLSPAERDEAWELLRTIAASGVTVLAVCSEAPSDAIRVPVPSSAGQNLAPDPAARPGATEHTAPAQPQDAPGDGTDTGVDSTDPPEHRVDPPGPDHPTDELPQQDTTQEGAAGAITEAGRA
ncbi:ATP-binding cassette domain-containing protein [Streptomyces sp. NPDC006879]|uniref:ATP-binding cassette domain-containing protein n=1 Tax=Streptomyces sp. NPDC006879 TaxID=3364767 RepID=UPI003691E991